MKITSASIPAQASVPARASAAPAAQGAAAGSAAAPLQSEVLAPAMQALQALPDFDHARVAQLRDALAKGELPFDPARLAGLIARFHGGGQ